MSEGICTITVTGRLGAEPEVRSTNNGSVLKFRVAVTLGFGEKERAQWFGVSVFGKRADGLAKVLHKGDAVAIAGRFEAREYQDKTGATKTSLDIVADSVALLGGKRDGERPAARPQRAESSGTEFSGGNADDDIPF